ncbi:MAG: IS66 family transposase [Actinomycetota bacterium]
MDDSDVHAQCRRENEGLKKRVQELERKLEEALRSQKRQAAPFSKGPPKEHPLKSGRKPGAEYGRHARRPAPRKIDEIIPVPAPPRCGCGGRTEPVEVVAQYQTEIPRKPIHRRFDIQIAQCRDCGQHVRGRHPLQTSQAVGAAASQLGPDAQAMVATLKDEIGLSYGDIQKLLHRSYGIQLSRGGAAQTVLRIGERIQAAYEGIRIVLRRSRVVYPDETGWKVRGSLQWLWVFVSRTATLFAIRDSRGHDVPQELLGADWSGTMVHDGWSPYDFFLKAEHQQCLAHLMRRCTRLIQTATGAAIRFPRQVLDLLKDGLDLRDRRDAREISPHGLAVAQGHLFTRFHRLLLARITDPENWRFLKHIGYHMDQIFTFLKRRGIEATSWPADQAIRPAVVNRKVFGGNREELGARAQERIASVAATCVQRGVDLFGYLARVICAPEDRRDQLARRLLALPAS